MISLVELAIDRNECEAVESVLQSGLIAQGARVREFEEAFASYIGTKHAIATSSGTSALHVALLASGISPGDEVITTPFSFIASANSIMFGGAKPIFVDIDENTFNIDADLIETRITSRTKAILPVHLYGNPCDLGKLTDICHKYNLNLIEDACQAHGAEYQGRKVGSFGVGCFSFYPTKNMTTGEGGMITTDNDEIAERARKIREHGQNGRYNHEILGFNYRMTDIAGALGLCQIKKLDEFNRRRIENAKFLTEAVSGIPGLVPPYVAPEVRHVFHQYTLRVTGEFGMSRDELQTRLAEKGIGSAIHYSKPLHKQLTYIHLGYKDRLPQAERAAREVLSLPVHPNVSMEDLEIIAGALAGV